MLKNLFLSLSALMLLTACNGDSSSGGSSESPATASASADNCAIGHYDFRTVADGKFHFDYRLLAGGNVAYNLSGGPRGQYSVNGSQVSMNNVFPGQPDRLLILNVTQTGADCRFLTMQGNVNGAAVVSRRLD